MKIKFYKSERRGFVSLHLLLVFNNSNEATGNLDFVSSLLKDSNKNELKSQRSLLFSSRGFLISFLFHHLLRGTHIFFFPTYFVFIYSFSFISVAEFLRMLWYNKNFFNFHVLFIKKSSEAPRRVNVTATMEAITNGGIFTLNNCYYG